MSTPRVDVEQALFVVALAIIVAYGASLRSEDPLSSPALGAEDPYTHVVFTRQHADLGYFDDARQIGTSLYPPGMHGFAAVFAPLAGVSFYDYARFAPVAFGAFCVLGVGVLGRRLGGTGAGLAAALLAAMMPELITRTNLYFPTTLDLALLPALLYSGALVLERERWALAPLAVTGAVLSYSHPWIVPVACGALAVYGGLRAMSAATPRDVVAQLAPLLAGLAPLVGLSAAARWGQGNTGFADFLAETPLAGLAGLELPTALLWLVLTLCVLAASAAGLGLAILLALARPRLSAPIRVSIGVLAGTALLAVGVTLGRDPPDLVNYRGTLGPVVILLSLAALPIALARRTPIGDMGVAFVLFAFPLTAVTIFETGFDAKFWPSRMVAYLGLACVILCGAAIGAVADGLVALLNRRVASRFAMPAVALAGALVLAGAVTAKPAHPYDWYRLYDGESFESMQELSERLATEEGSRVIIASWQPGLVLKALGDPEPIRYAPRFYNDTEKREQILQERAAVTYVLVDRFVHKAIAREPERGIDLSFLDDGSYTVVDVTSDQQWALYRWEGRP